jgi:hypothetical protein
MRIKPSHIFNPDPLLSAFIRVKRLLLLSPFYVLKIQTRINADERG